MYELVSTSVPNGLIAGTHGFGTVAMTKGMPNAIRGRVEGFCAYPHRTSAHDENYFVENPANWFHLQFSTGDHVIGRTVPAEFDYTGRTNRVSHALVLGAQEMPVHGAAFVLTSEAKRFVSNWTGEPKYLPVDKVTAGRLCLVDIPKKVMPSNWISAFGPDGESFARRFAALLKENVTTGVKSIYFKTSTSVDRDGTKLLGLFSDLIDLLPEEIRPSVTFSTFAACVPGAVTCHLRGVYDKDRAFEVASAVQPWVDLESGRIVHGELLPAEISDENGTQPEEVASSAGEKPGVRKDGARLSVPKKNGQPSRPVRRTVGDSRPNGGSCSRSMWVIVLLVVAMVLVAGAVCSYWVYADNQRRKREAHSLREREARLQAERRVAEVCEKRKRQEEKEKARQEEEQRRSAELAAQKRQEEKEKARQQEEASAKNRKKVEVLLQEIKKKQQEDEDDKKAHQAELGKFPSHLSEILKTDGGLESKLRKDSEKAKFTNENSIVVWWWNGTSMDHKACAYERVERRAIGNQGAKVEYRLKVDVGESPWVIYRLLGQWNSERKSFESERVYWQWRDALCKKSRKLFENGPTADLVTPAFGEKGAAWELWQDFTPETIWCVAWGEKGKSFFHDQPELDASAFSKEQKKGIDEQIKRLTEEKFRLKNEETHCENDREKYRTDYAKVKDFHDRIDRIRKEDIKKFKGLKEDKKQKQQANKEEIAKLWDEIRQVLLEDDLCHKTADEQDMEKAISKLKEKSEKCTHNHQKKIEDKEREIKQIEKKKMSVDRATRERAYWIECVDAGLKKGMKLGLNERVEKGIPLE